MLLIIGIILAVVYLLINLLLLYMFINNLLRLNKQLIEQFMENATMENSLTPSENEQFLSLHGNDQSMSRSIEVILDQYSRSDSQHIKKSVNEL